MSKDELLQQKVRAELAQHRKDACAIGVAVHRGVVTLTGTVDSWSEKHAIEAAAFRAAGVREIANEIAIKSMWTTAISDTEIAEAAHAALRATRAANRNIRLVVSDNGDVALTGSVETQAEREDVEHTIRRLSGVRYITNDLQIVEPRQ